MNKQDFKEYSVEFKVNNKRHFFKIYSNLPNTFGMNIEGAVQNWVNRTTNYSAKSLVDYMNSKFPPDEPVAMTHEKYHHLE